MEICPFCGKEGKSVKYHIWRMHGEGTSFNPNKGYNNGTREAWNKGLSKETDIRVEKNAKSVKESLEGKPRYGCCAKEWHTKPEAKIASSKGGGYRENAGRSKKFKVFDSFGTQTTLQSTYEYACFEILCELGLRWVRPKSLKYKEKNYFADFYLLDFDVYLDTKNDYKAKQDKDKIRLVNEQNNNRVFVLLKEQITKEVIVSII